MKFTAAPSTTFRLIGIFIAVASLVFAIPPEINAQETGPEPLIERGFASDRAYQQLGIDSVDLATGTVSLVIPIGPRYPVNGGFSYGLTLVHNSSVWDFENANGKTQAFPTRISNAGLGWRLSMGELYDPEDTDNPQGNGWVFVSQDGAQHRFFNELHVDEEDPLDSDTWYTHDGSYLRLILVDSSNRWIDFPDGTQYRFVADGADKWKLDRIEDSFGNYVSISDTEVGGQLVTRTISDTQGRTHTIDYVQKTVDGETVDYVQYVNLEGFGNTTSTYSLHYSDVPALPRSLQDDDLAMTSENVRVSILARLVFPETTVGESLDSRSYSFGYCLDTACQGFDGVLDAPGMMKSLRFPTGGGIAWEFQTWDYSGLDFEAGCSPPMSNECKVLVNLEWAGIKSKTLTDRHPDLAGAVSLGTWSYDTWVVTPGPTVPAIPEERRTIVTSTEGDDTAHYFRVMPRDFNGDHDEYLHAWDYALPFTRRVPDTDGGRFLSVEYFDGQAQVDPTDERLLIGDKLRSVFVKYRHDEFDPPFDDAYYRHVNRHLESKKTIYHDDIVSDGGTPSDPSDDTHRYAVVDYSDFDGLGHFRTATTGGNFDSGNARTTTVAYNLDRGTYPGSFTMIPKTDPWILETYEYREETEGGVTARQDFCFDSWTGALLRRRTIESSYVNAGSLGEHDVVEAFTYESGTGNRSMEALYGADVQVLSTGDDLCDLTLPGSPYYRVDHTYSFGVLESSRYYDTLWGEALPFYSVDLDIDSSTGLVSRSYDMAGLYTDYEYDARFRLTWAKPQTGLQAGSDAWTEYEYVPYSTEGIGPEVEVYRRPNGSSTGALARLGYEYDPLGRMVVERGMLEDGSWMQKTTEMNAQGWLTSTSERGDPTKKTVFSDFDPFGRPGTTTLPDGMAITSDYTGVSSLSRTVKVYTSIGGSPAERDATTTENYDRQGRLVGLVEPAGASGADVTGSYGYDIGGRLAQVSITSGATTQNRYMTYDNRGFLNSQQMPETGPVGNGNIIYSAFDPLGNAGQITEGGNELLYSFDKAGRLDAVEVVASCGPVQVVDFTYGQTNGSDNWRLGKLESIRSFNYVDGVEMVCLGASQLLPDEVFLDGFESGDTSAWSSEISAVGDLTIVESYTYGGLGGRVSKLDVTVNSDTFTETFTWNELGLITSIGYPDLSGYTEPAGAVSAVTYEYANGYLTGVPGFATSIDYHPNGAINTIEHANGVDDVHGLDPNYMLRTQRIKARRNTVDVWDTGAYSYDGAGNIKAIGSDSFVYDKVGRLLDGTALGGTANQSYTYDGFGNLTSITDSQGTRSITVDPTTNRLSSPASYDPAGNLTSWGGHTYGWRPTGELKSRTATGLNKWYAYTGGGERVVSTDQLNGVSTYTLRDLDGKVLRVFENDGGVWSWGKDYVYRNGLLLAAKDAIDTNHFTLDHLGTPRYVSDSTGAGVIEHAYFGFGEEATSVWNSEAMKFTGHERDLEGTPDSIDDLDYMHARYFNPGIGRFLAIDPIGGGIGSSQSWNRYTYVVNNPVNLIDPYGLSDCRTTGEGGVICRDDLVVTADAPHSDPSFWLPDGGNRVWATEIDINDRLRAQPRVSSMTDVLGQVAALDDGGFWDGMTYWQRVNANYQLSYQGFYGVVGFPIPSESGALYGALAYFTGSPTIASTVGIPTFVDWMVRGFRPISGLTVTSTGTLAIMGSAFNGAAAFSAMQVGLGAGSLVAPLFTRPEVYERLGY